MIIENYGVILRKLEKGADLELVRQWRNSPEVNQFMFFKDHITSEMQLNWFEKINNIHNYFFIVEYNGKKIGLINLKNVDFEKKEAESGFFIGEAEYRASTIGAQANLALLDYGYEKLGIERIIASVREDNKPALAFNKALGFVKTEDHEDLFYLSKNDYLKKTEKLKKLLNKY